VSYLAARGLPIRHVDSQGRCGGLLRTLEHAAPKADLLLVHAGTVDLGRLFAEQRMRPLLLGADPPPPSPPPRRPLQPGRRSTPER
jgi:hypothetical protein